MHVAHVVDDIDAHVIGVAGFHEYLSNLDRLQVDTSAAAERQIGALLSREDRERLNARAVVLVSPTPWKALLDYATGERIDLIVAGTHGRGAVGHALMGSVAERLVRFGVVPRADCPAS